MRPNICVHNVVSGITCFVSDREAALGEDSAEEPTYFVVWLLCRYEQTTSAISVAGIYTCTKMYLINITVNMNDKSRILKPTLPWLKIVVFQTLRAG